MSSHVFSNYVIHCTLNIDITVLDESVVVTLVVLGHAEGNRIVQDKSQHSGETVHRHVAMVITLITSVMAANIIKPADHTFQDVLEHIQHSDRY